MGCFAIKLKLDKVNFLSLLQCNESVKVVLISYLGLFTKFSNIHFHLKTSFPVNLPSQDAKTFCHISNFKNPMIHRFLFFSITKAPFSKSTLKLNILNIFQDGRSMKIFHQISQLTWNNSIKTTLYHHHNIFYVFSFCY